MVLSIEAIVRLKVKAFSLVGSSQDLKGEGDGGFVVFYFGYKYDLFVVFYFGYKYDLFGSWFFK